MVLTGPEAIVYLYQLNDKTQKFDVDKVEFRKGSEQYKLMNEGEGENENENQDNQEQPQEEQNQPMDEQEQ